MLYEVLFYLVLAALVAVSIAFIIVDGKKKVLYDNLKKEYLTDKDKWNDERVSRQEYMEKQEESYKILSENNTDLMREIEETKVTIDEVKEKNRALIREVNSLTTKAVELNAKLEAAIAVNNALKEAKVSSKDENKAGDSLENKKREELIQIAKKNGITGVSKKSKAELLKILTK